MANTGMLDLIAGVLAIAILLGGLTMLFLGVRAFDDQKK